MIALLITLGVLAALALLCITNRISEKRWVFSFMLFFDIFLCAVVTGNADMTISARCGLYLRHPPPPLIWGLLGRGLNKLQKGHCELAILNDMARAKRAIQIFTVANAVTDRVQMKALLRGR
jgi:hypothetical protein